LAELNQFSAQPLAQETAGDLQLLEKCLSMERVLPLQTTNASPALTFAVLERFQFEMTPPCVAAIVEDLRLNAKEKQLCTASRTFQHVLQENSQPTFRENAAQLANWVPLLAPQHALLVKSAIQITRTQMEISFQHASPPKSSISRLPRTLVLLMLQSLEMISRPTLERL
jgi:hypothetical protein